jgi:hypothetical protein
LIARQLGLKPESTKDKDNHEVSLLKPTRPFSIQVQMENENIAEAYQRIQEEQWKRTSSYKEAMKSESQGAKGFSTEILTLIGKHKGNLDKAYHEGQNQSRGKTLKEGDINSALGVALFDVIKSILDEEWAP